MQFQLTFDTIISLPSKSWVSEDVSLHTNNSSSSYCNKLSATNWIWQGDIWLRRPSSPPSMQLWYIEKLIGSTTHSIVMGLPNVVGIPMFFSYIKIILDECGKNNNVRTCVSTKSLNRLIHHIEQFLRKKDHHPLMRWFATDNMPGHLNAFFLQSMPTPATHPGPSSNWTILWWTISSSYSTPCLFKLYYFNCNFRVLYKIDKSCFLSSILTILQ